MSNQEYKPPDGPPPISSPPPVHRDAGPYNEERGMIPAQNYGPPQGYDYGGYNDTRGYYGPPQQGWNQQGGWQQPGPQQAPYGGYYGPPQQGMYYGQGPPVTYVDQRSSPGADGCYAALLAALTCCCCLELLF
ncbi:uncharacterized protein PV06_05757 [Exophiala oligosperma]|uniref:Uncharacterized protein n=1 Tax=Exophiala oligosperma TaxID=215243 RepID=A0A0D2DGQ3_9EURO|nr:uncharacterized protein PV06_05757 [Exophiala oligosperma]KIW42188.1 hypothetical protein PV06_05757 [Exophiala oligosperma]